MASIKQILQETPSGSSLFPNKFSNVVTTNKDETVPQVFKKLSENGILSLPVLDEQEKCIAVVSVMDLLAHLLNNFAEENVKNVVRHTFDYFSMLITEKEIEKEKVSYIREIGKLDKAVFVKTNTPLYDTVKLMVENNAHRVLVSDENGKFSNIITQSRVVQLISMGLDTLPTASKSLKQLNLGFKNVLSVKTSSSTYDAFKLIRDTNHSSVAVVDDHGVLVGNVSVSDIKLIGNKMELFDLFAVPTSDYLKQIKEKSNIQSAALVAHAGLPLSCTENDTFGNVIKTLTHYRVHRIYIVDDHKKLIGVVSLQDVLQQILKDSAGNANL